MTGLLLMSDPRVAAVPVSESGQPLVDLGDLPALRIDTSRGDPRGLFRHVRRGLADRLCAAAEALPAGLALAVVEGYRPAVLQRRYFRRYRDSLDRLHPGTDPRRLDTLASRYVSPPDIAPHCAGAAIDLTLASAAGDALDLGTAVNATPEQSDGGCYTAATTISVAGRANRNILCGVLSASGLVNYPTEWWHWSYGDRYWAIATGAPAAIYGPASPPS